MKKESISKECCYNSISIIDCKKVLLLTGPRQVGKSTILQHCAPSGYYYVTLDDFDARELALNDPALFFQKYQTPVIIDEIQYAPNLLSQIKIIVDKDSRRGLDNLQI